MLWMSRFVPFVLFVLRKTARREESARPYDGPRAVWKLHPVGTGQSFTLRNSRFLAVPISRLWELKAGTN
jgi:hypothetical protein